MRSGATPTGLGILGAIALLYPTIVLGFTQSEPYEAEITRWVGLGLIGAAGMWSWAQRLGGVPARRLTRWLRAAAGSALLFVLTTNPVFLVIGFALLIAGVLDAMLERATIAAFDLMARLQGDEA